MGDNVASLARAWLAAKHSEEFAAKQRIDIEEQLAQALDHKPEGAVTHSVDDFKITLTQRVYRRVDENVWADVKQYCPKDLHPIKTCIEADAKGIKWLAANEPKIWAKIAKAFTTTPAKLNFRIEEK